MLQTRKLIKFIGFWQQVHHSNNNNNNYIDKWLYYMCLLLNTGVVICRSIDFLNFFLFRSMLN